MSPCKICNVDGVGGNHKNTEEHQFNYLMHEWNNYRKKIAKDKHGIEISFSIKTSAVRAENYITDTNHGKYTFTLSSEKFSSVNNTLTFGLQVSNTRKDAMYIMKATVLVPYAGFHIEDERNMCETNTVIELLPGQKYNYKVRFQLQHALNGSFQIPIAFTFQVKSRAAEDKMDSLSIARKIVILVSDYEEIVEEEGKSPFKFGKWEGILVTIPPIETPFQTNNYPIPTNYRRVLMSGLNARYMYPQEVPLLNRLKDIFQPDENGKGTVHSTSENYADFFHFLLWLDEIGQRLMLERYNMTKVTMIAKPNRILELKVPGLAEKRPSLIPGDFIQIRFLGDHTVYRAIVRRINDKTIDIHSMHPDLWDAITENPDIELDVSFEANRLIYERMHKAVDQCVRNNLLPILFPSGHLLNQNIPLRMRMEDIRFFNRSILDNNEQKSAVLNILNGTSRQAPYIVFGPPGTGKTVTIVEAILQIKEKLKDSKILVCAPANAACDMLTGKLIQFIHDKNELIRIHTESRSWADVPENIRPYSNHTGTTYTRISINQLASYRIVITTLGLIGKYSGEYRPDHVFIDEAAQAFEPEADIAISTLALGKQLVLAGDPKQLGPQCASAAAAKLKLDVSLLERLMETNALYTSGDNRFITMLRLNYRAHPEVLEVPNRLFYDNQLQAVNVNAANDSIAKICIYMRTIPHKKLKAVKGSAVEFCSVLAEEKREGKSPSYYNESEIQMVVKYVEAMLSLPNIKVLQSEIGIITPYIRQLHRIKNRLQQRGHNEIEVGTTEVFQGREKRIIIISTVRSKEDLLLIDEKYKLGFVKNEKRMNVALTRAMSKLIIIGNPHVLGSTYNPRNRGNGDKNWESFIQFCESKQAFFGAEYLRRTDGIRHNIIGRFANIQLKDSIYNRGENAINNKNNVRRNNP